MEPVGLAIGGILALVLGIALFDDDDDDSPAPLPEPEPEFDDEGRLIGTDGDDDIVYDETDNPYPRAVLAGAGDDTISLELGVDTYGEAGDDVIMIDAAYGSQIDGGDGNDSITIDRAIKTDVLGGDGDDTISLGDAAGEEPNSVDAGAGDDVVQITKNPSLNSNWSNHTVPVVLGEGADSLQIDFRPADMRPGQAGSGTAAEVADFDPAEDFLTITIAEGEQNFLRYEVVEENGYSEILLTYQGLDADSAPIEYNSAIRLMGVQNLPVSSFRVVTG